MSTDKTQIYKYLDEFTYGCKNIKTNSNWIQTEELADELSLDNDIVVYIALEEKEFEIKKENNKIFLSKRQYNHIKFSFNVHQNKLETQINELQSQINQLKKDNKLLQEEPEEQTGIVYEIVFNCGHRYIGKTTENINERKKEHIEYPLTDIAEMIKH